MNTVLRILIAVLITHHVICPTAAPPSRYAHMDPATRRVAREIEEQDARIEAEQEAASVALARQLSECRDSEPIADNRTNDDRAPRSMANLISAADRLAIQMALEEMGETEQLALFNQASQENAPATSPSTYVADRSRSTDVSVSNLNLRLYAAQMTEEERGELYDVISENLSYLATKLNVPRDINRVAERLGLGQGQSLVEEIVRWKARRQAGVVPTQSGRYPNLAGQIWSFLKNWLPGASRPQRQYVIPVSPEDQIPRGTTPISREEVADIFYSRNGAGGNGIIPPLTLDIPPGARWVLLPPGMVPFYPNEGPPAGALVVNFGGNADDGAGGSDAIPPPPAPQPIPGGWLSDLASIFGVSKPDQNDFFVRGAPDGTIISGVPDNSYAPSPSPRVPYVERAAPAPSTRSSYLPRPTSEPPARPPYIPGRLSESWARDSNRPVVAGAVRGPTRSARAPRPSRSSRPLHDPSSPPASRPPQASRPPYAPRPPRLPRPPRAPYISGIAGGTNNTPPTDGGSESSIDYSHRSAITGSTPVDLVDNPGPDRPKVDIPDDVKDTFEEDVRNILTQITKSRGNTYVYHMGETALIPFYIPRPATKKLSNDECYLVILQERFGSNYHWNVYAVMGDNADTLTRSQTAEYAVMLHDKLKVNNISYFIRRSKTFDRDTLASRSKDVLPEKHTSVMYILDTQTVKRVPPEKSYLQSDNCAVLVKGDPTTTRASISWSCGSRADRELKKKSKKLAKMCKNNSEIIIQKCSNFNNEFANDSRESAPSERPGPITIVKYSNINEEGISISMPVSITELESNACYMIDSKTYGGVYYWIGKNAPVTVQRKGIERIEEYLCDKLNLPKTRVTVMEEGKEVPCFKINFNTW